MSLRAGFLCLFLSGQSLCSSGKLHSRQDISSPAVGVEPCKRVGNEVQRWYRENNIGVCPSLEFSTQIQNLTASTLGPTNYSNFNLAPFEQIALAYVPGIAPTPIRPSLAYSCLNSVPLNQNAALAYVEYLRPMIEWHSTLDYLQSPPRGYLSEGVDLAKGLTDIAAKLKSSAYKNEFEWLADLHTLINVRVRDSHFGVPSPLLTGLFHFKRGVKFVSISQDGRSPPRVFLRGEYLPSLARWRLADRNRRCQTRQERLFTVASGYD
jgi:hypothetical protein